MVTATLAVLATVLVVVVLLLTLIAVQRRAHRGRIRPAPASVPTLGSPAQVWLERGEAVVLRLRRLGADQPVLGAVGDDADAVLAELRTAAAEVAGLDAARARLPVSLLQAERQRLDAAIAAAPDGTAATELRSARDAVSARLALAGQHRAATDALLARMRAAVAGLERAEDELAGILAAPSDAAAARAREATTDLADRLAGLRAGLAEVRTISTAARSAASEPPVVPPPASRVRTPGRATAAGQGQPGDIPGSVEGPPAN